MSFFQGYKTFPEKENAYPGSPAMIIVMLKLFQHIVPRIKFRATNKPPCDKPTGNALVHSKGHPL
jgi:hypothetical protein